MKKYLNHLIILCFFSSMLLNTSLLAAQTSNEWIYCWMTGVELSKNPHHSSEAIEAYTAAIKAQDLSSVSKHPYLYNERAKLYLKTNNFDQAIQDFSFVLNQAQVSKEETLEALWGRGQCYLALGKQAQFEQDRRRLEELEPFTTVLEENANYMILKLGSHICRDVQNQERLVKVLRMQKKIKSSKDVVFSPSGLAIVKKNHSA